MTKNTPLFSWLTLIIVTLACGSTTLQTAPGPAPAESTSPSPETSSAPGEGSALELESTKEALTFVPGLRVVYLRGGNLWSWTEADGNMQLTDTGDISAIRVSDDGQLLAFMRGSEVRTVRMDGTDVHSLGNQPRQGSALSFAPSGSLLAVSTGDHIDVIDIKTNSKTTVVTYPTVPDGYYPEVIWSLDSFGFKTVIPAPTENGLAEMLFVFTDGTVASLAKFVMSPLSESLPYLSPDGGYLIYVANLGEGQVSLYLMDSSGATRTYGEPTTRVRAYGWLPDSKRFVYGWEEPRRTFIGNVGGPPAYNEIMIPLTVRWVDNEHYLAIENETLVLGDFDGARTLIDSPVSGFDFIP